MLIVIFHNLYILLNMNVNSFNHIYKTLNVYLLIDILFFYLLIKLWQWYTLSS